MADDARPTVRVVIAVPGMAAKVVVVEPTGDAVADALEKVAGSIRDSLPGLPVTILISK